MLQLAEELKKVGLISAEKADKLQYAYNKKPKGTWVEPEISEDIRMEYEEKAVNAFVKTLFGK